MNPADIAKLSTWVLLGAFSVSMLFGAVAQRTHFCTMGAISDVVNIGDWNRARQWALAVGVAVLGFGVLTVLGLIEPSKTLYASKHWLWLSTVVGGLMFGFGMTLAAGCGSKTLVRLGSGSLKALVVFVVMGIAAFATLKGITAVLRVATVDRVGLDMGTLGTRVPDWLSAAGLSAPWAAGLAALVLGGALLAWALLNAEFWRFDNLLAGFGIGTSIVLMWMVSGVLGHVAEHPETLQEAFLTTNSGRVEALTFTAPFGYALDWLMFFSDKNKVLTLGVVSVVGVIVGSALQAVLSRSFRWEGFSTTEDLVNHLGGAVLMGVGGVTALGCTVGQGLSGISTLSLNSFSAVAGIIAGAVLAFRYQMWRLERQV